MRNHVEFPTLFEHLPIDLLDKQLRIPPMLGEMGEMMIFLLSYCRWNDVVQNRMRGAKRNMSKRENEEGQRDVEKYPYMATSTSTKDAGTADEFRS
jgi:hypothetical protein